MGCAEGRDMGGSWEERCGVFMGGEMWGVQGRRDVGYSGEERCGVFREERCGVFRGGKKLNFPFPLASQHVTSLQNSNIPANMT